jgi:hypothetical protein
MRSLPLVGEQIIRSASQHRTAVHHFELRPCAVQHGIQETSKAFLQKPFTLGTLARKMRDAFEQSKTAR